ncbi:MAG: helix-hairpin-helix domain-containing protein [Clostridiales bacterium]|jgi:competence protein ComEA|nr:helix-hairpin-helix domain-containing protein [Clostridiales bacterium]
MEQRTFSERLLLVAALILCAILVGYNAFYSPQASEPVIIYRDFSVESLSNEEYQPLPGESIHRLNLNTASAEELAQHVPGIGDLLAQDIVEYREKHQGFQRLDELKNIEGIGDKTFEKMKPYLTLS